jgi:hypothetical protein
VVGEAVLVDHGGEAARELLGEDVEMGVSAR